MPKKIIFDKEAKAGLKAGIDKVAKSVSSTLGPRGKGVVIASGYGQYPIVTKDGVTVAKSIFLEDEVENAGAYLIRGAAEKSLDNSGDGTTTSVVLAQSILNNGLEEVENKKNAQQIKSGIDKAVAVVVERLKSKSVPVEDIAMVKQVATIAANNDEKLGSLLSDAYEKIGPGGLLTIEDSHTIHTFVDVLEGAEMPRGYSNDSFVTDTKRMEAVYENPRICVMNYELKTMREIEPFFKNLAENGHNFASHPLVIIAKGFDGEVHNTLLTNKLRGMKILLIQAPSAYQIEALVDMATVSGAQIVSDEFGLKPGDATYDMLGACKKIVCSKHSTVLIGGIGEEPNMNELKGKIQLLISGTDNPELKAIYEKRLARLSGSVGVVKVGGATDIEITERKHRTDDAVRAVKSAYEEGVVVGGGVALIRCMKALDDIECIGDEATGVDLIRRACEAPLLKMLENAGLSDGAIVKVKESKEENFGLNIKTGEFEDLFKAGVLDPVKVVRCALENAASVAGQVIVSDVLIVEMKPPGV